MGVLSVAYLLLALLVLNAILHAMLVQRHGAAENKPFALFTLVYAALAVIVALGVPYALWITLALSAFGLVGLTVTFNGPDREKSLDKAIWVADAAVVLVTLYQLFLAG